MDCIFCGVAQKQPESVVSENDHAVAVADSHPLVRGHLLVITKKHYDSLEQVPDAELLALMRLAIRLRGALMKGLGAEGVDIRHNYRPFLHESALKVNHVHVHLIPRWRNDTLYNRALCHELPLRTTLTAEETAELVAKVRPLIGQ